MYDVLSHNAPLFQSSCCQLIFLMPSKVKNCLAMKYYPLKSGMYIIIFVWKNDANDRLCKMIGEGTTDDLRGHICTILPQFMEHCFVKRQQALAYKPER